MIVRNLSKIIQSTKKSILLLGPRQVGKSTLLKSLKPDVTINLSLESEFLLHSANPDHLVSLIKGNKFQTVFIDEIQRLPSLLNTIQAIIDDWEDAPRFFLSGSSARKLKRGQANLLPGRIFVYYLSGLSACELDFQLDINRALCIGFLPEPYLNDDKKFSTKLLRNYAGTYLVEEIQSEALTRNIQGFARFLETIAKWTGRVIDFSKMSVQAKVSRSTCIRYVEILEDTLIAQRIWNFDETEADIIRHPKLYFFDLGVLNGLMGNFITSPDRIGILFEHLVFNQIRNSSLTNDEDCKIYFFRTKNGLEVDFIVKSNGKIYAIEVKSGEIHSSDENSLNAFKNYYPDVHRCILVSPKEKYRRLNKKILICGVSDMLKELEFML